MVIYFLIILLLGVILFLLLLLLLMRIVKIFIIIIVYLHQHLLHNDMILSHGLLRYLIMDNNGQIIMKFNLHNSHVVKRNVPSSQFFIPLIIDYVYNNHLILILVQLILLVFHFYILLPNKL